MLNPIQIEKIFQDYMDNLSNLAHDGVINVSLALLHELNLLIDFYSNDTNAEDLTQYFHVIENPEKITLFNEQFIIWILPKMEQEIPITYVIIALNTNNKTNLEIVFTTAGIYNTPKYVLKVLQYFLLDMIETEATINAFEKNQ